MVEEEKFRVILKGYGSDKGEYYIEQEFAALFKIPQEKAKALFKAVPKTIKEDMTKDQAKKYKAAIEKTGAKCEIESTRFDLSGLSLE